MTESCIVGFVVPCAVVGGCTACCVISCCYCGRVSMARARRQQRQRRIARMREQVVTSQPQPRYDTLKKKMKERFLSTWETVYSRVYGNKAYQVSDAGNGDIEEFCTICWENYDDPKERGVLLGLVKKCGHYFHFDCLWTWLSTHQSCPLCRTNTQLTEEDILGIPLDYVIAEFRSQRERDCGETPGESQVRKEHQTPCSSESKEFGVLSPQILKAIADKFDGRDDVKATSIGKDKTSGASNSVAGASRPADTSSSSVDTSSCSVDRSPDSDDRSPDSLDRSPDSLDRSPGSIDRSPVSDDSSPGYDDRSPVSNDRSPYPVHRSRVSDTSSSDAHSSCDGDVAHDSQIDNNIMYDVTGDVIHDVITTDDAHECSPRPEENGHVSSTPEHLHKVTILIEAKGQHWTTSIVHTEEENNTEQTSERGSRGAESSSSCSHRRNSTNNDSQ